VPRGQRHGSLHSYSRLSRPKPLLFFPSISSNVLMRLSGPSFRPTTSQKIWWSRKSNPDLSICSQEPWPLDHRDGHSTTLLKSKHEIFIGYSISVNDICTKWLALLTHYTKVDTFIPTERSNVCVYLRKIILILSRLSTCAYRNRMWSEGQVHLKTCFITSCQTYVVMCKTCVLISKTMPNWPDITYLTRI
jgi:hypothetical protein